MSAQRPWRRLLAVLFVLPALTSLLPAAAAALTSAPPIPLSGVRLIVEQAGLQQISAAALAAVGIDLNLVDVERLHLQTRNGSVALAISGSGTGRRIEFYAPLPGDRWNTFSTYWLSLAAPPPAGWPRIAERDVTVNPALPTLTGAFQVQEWHQPATYVSTDAGSDGDHWFSADLSGMAGAVLSSADVSLNDQLPPAAGPLTVTINGSLPAATVLPAVLRLTLGSTTQAVTLTGSGSFTQSISFSDSADGQLLIEPAATAPLRVYLDRVSTILPVALTLSAAQTELRGHSSAATYQFNTLPLNAQLFDITDAAQPVRLTGLTDRFSDSSANRHYLISSSAATPRISTIVSADLLTPRTIDALYLAPQELLGNLTPLLNHRISQGYRVAAIALESIYDHWSAGQVDPEAIRSFLAYTSSNWTIAPTSVTLVGDGSVDPRRYRAAVPPTLLPPYLANVDPWLGETACDSCFARFGSVDPRDDALPDMQVGRLPIKSAAELRALISKLLAYEQAADVADWRNRLLLVADDNDGAGDFRGALSDVLAALPPRLRSTTRVFNPAAAAPDPLRDSLQTRALIQQDWTNGAGLVIYHGHSSPQQWASNRTVAGDGSISYQPLMQIYDPLNNQSRLPVVLAMTCLTSAFQTPYLSGMTLDEWLLLTPSGGAAAVWGSAGLGVAYGHDLLQDGFLAAFAAATAADSRPTLGDLTSAGLNRLYQDGICCQDALFHQILLGDPLTPLHLQPLDLLHLPLMTR